MNPLVLLELVAKWEAQANDPQCEDGSPEAALDNARERGARQGKRRCAEELNLLIKLLAKPS